MNKKFICLSIIVLSIIFSALCRSSISANAVENTQMPRCREGECLCPRMEGDILRKSINNLKEKGTLTEDDMKNIDSYMIKEREVKENEIKEKIYNAECEKIDTMVEEKVITKEKGEKLKTEVKENLQQINRNMKKDKN